MRRRAWIGIALGLVGTPFAFYGAWQFRDELVEKRVAVVVPGKIVRGAWQRPGPLRRIIAREHIKTVVTLSAINVRRPQICRPGSQVIKESRRRLGHPADPRFLRDGRADGPGCRRLDLRSAPPARLLPLRGRPSPVEPDPGSLSNRARRLDRCPSLGRSLRPALGQAERRTSRTAELIEAFASRKDATDATAMAPDPRPPADPRGL